MTKKSKEIAAIPREELEKKLKELKKELVKLNAQIATGTALKNAGEVRRTKKTIARILTILKRRKEEKKRNE